VNFDTLKTRIRDKTGWSSTDDLPTARLEEIINYVYQIRIPERINWDRQQTWVYCDLTANTGDYDMATTLRDSSGGTVVGTRIRLVKPPTMLLIDADNTEDLGFTYDADGFWKEYPPHANEDTSEPQRLLMDGRTLFPRPIPDITYTIQMWGVWRPVPLSAAGDTVEPDWEQAVISGGVAMIREDDENWEQAQAQWGVFEDRINDIISISQARVPGRVKGRW
jgi:hypothetical protein